MYQAIYNGNIYVERDVFAQAILIKDGKILSVGTNEEILGQAPDDVERIDAKGNTVVPGFNDSHMHLHDLGKMMKIINVYGATSIPEIISRGKELIERTNPKADSVVRGVGWNQDLFTDENRCPNRFDLDQISTEHAIILDRVCGHCVSCNTVALKMAGIDENTPQVEGGEIEKDESGYPTGVFKESAILELKKIIPPETEEELHESLISSMDSAVKLGLTSVQSRDVIDDNFKLVINTFKNIYKNNESKLRVNLQCSIDYPDMFDEFASMYHTGMEVGSPYLKMGPIKLFADGSLGSRSAYMKKPYEDDKTTTGMRVLTQEEMDYAVSNAHKHGFQVITHAIGDAAIDEIINSYEKVIGEGPNTLRHAVVHLQITDMPLLERLKTSDILAMVQPIFLNYDLHVVESRVGKELSATSYAFNTLEKLGVHTSYGTDAPVEGLSPINCIHAAVNRQDLERFPKGGFYPNEKVDIYQAVDNYTIGSAYASFEENVKGRIKAGYYADVTILDKDIFHIPPEEILNTEVVMTIIGGEIVYEK